MRNKECAIFSYHIILKRHRLEWLLHENQNVAVYHFLSEIRPVPLKNRIESDLNFSQHSLRKELNGFVKLSVILAEAFQLVDNGKPRSENSDINSTRSLNNNKSNYNNKNKDNKSKNNKDMK